MSAGGVIEVTDLTVRFGGVTSLDGMSVTFEPGTCGLIGPNGAGKTTFFNVLSGFVRPAAGTVRAFVKATLHGDWHGAAVANPFGILAVVVAVVLLVRPGWQRLRGR